MSPAPGPNTPRPPQNRLGSLFTILLVVLMLLLVVNFFNYNGSSTEDHNFQNLRRLAYEGEVDSIKFVGEARVEAKVHHVGAAEGDAWDVPVPEYAKTELSDMERLVARDVAPVDLPTVVSHVHDGSWRILSGYTMNGLATGLTGVFVEYMVSGQSHWASVTGLPADPALPRSSPSSGRSAWTSSRRRSATRAASATSRPPTSGRACCSPSCRGC